MVRVLRFRDHKYDARVADIFGNTTRTLDTLTLRLMQKADERNAILDYGTYTHEQLRNSLIRQANAFDAEHRRQYAGYFVRGQEVDTLTTLTEGANESRVRGFLESTKGRIMDGKQWQRLYEFAGDDPLLQGALERRKQEELSTIRGLYLHFNQRTLDHYTSEMLKGIDDLRYELTGVLRDIRTTERGKEGVEYLVDVANMLSRQEDAYQELAKNFSSIGGDHQIVQKIGQAVSTLKYYRRHFIDEAERAAEKVNGNIAVIQRQGRYIVIGKENMLGSLLQRVGRSLAIWQEADPIPALQAPTFAYHPVRVR